MAAGLVIVGDMRERRARSSGRLDRLRQAEVEHFDAAIGPQLDVGRLEIAVDDAPLVRGLERFGNLPGDRQRFVQRQPALRDPIGQRRTVDQFKDQRVRAVALFEAMNGGDVRMIE